MSDEDNKKANDNEVKYSNYYDNNINKFVAQYGGVVIVLAGVFLGNYVQKNKSNVKEKLKQFIDKF